MKKKPLVRTDYAIRRASDGRWLAWMDEHWTQHTWGTFAAAELFPRRSDARVYCDPGQRVVPVRCRALTSKKRNPKRTR